LAKPIAETELATAIGSAKPLYFLT